MRDVIIIKGEGKGHPFRGNQWTKRVFHNPGGWDEYQDVDDVLQSDIATNSTNSAYWIDTKGKLIKAPADEDTFHTTIAAEMILAGDSRIKPTADELQMAEMVQDHNDIEYGPIERALLARNFVKVRVYGLVDPVKRIASNPKDMTTDIVVNTLDQSAIRKLQRLVDNGKLPITGKYHISGNNGYVNTMDYMDFAEGKRLIEIEHLPPSIASGGNMRSRFMWKSYDVRIIKGERKGHPFRGNQWTRGVHGLPEQEQRLLSELEWRVGLERPEAVRSWSKFNRPGPVIVHHLAKSEFGKYYPGDQLENITADAGTSIATEGLKTGKEWFERPPSVYFTANKREAMEWGKYADVSMLVEIEIPDTLDSKVIPDTIANRDLGWKSAFRIEQNIPAQYIKSITVMRRGGTNRKYVRGKAQEYKRLNIMGKISREEWSQQPDQSKWIRQKLFHYATSEKPKTFVEIMQKQSSGKKYYMMVLIGSDDEEKVPVLD